MSLEFIVPCRALTRTQLRHISFMEGECTPHPMPGKHIHTQRVLGRELTVSTCFIDHLLYVPCKELAATLGPGCRFEALDLSPASNGYHDSRPRCKSGACPFNRREHWP